MTESAGTSGARQTVLLVVVGLVLATLAVSVYIRSSRAPRSTAGFEPPVPLEFMADLQTAADALRAHWRQTGTLEGSELIDRWGRPYMVRRVPASDTRVEIRTFGKDGLPEGTGHDYDLWIEIELQGVSKKNPPEPVGGVR